MPPKKSIPSSCGRGCAPDWDYRCCCEPGCPTKNTMKQFNDCPMAVLVSAFAIENVAYEGMPDVLRKYETLTRAKFTKVIKPIIRGWFSHRPERVNEVIQHLLDDPERHYFDDPTSDSESDTEAEIKNMDINAPADDDTESPNNEVVTSVQMAKRG